MNALDRAKTQQMFETGSLTLYRVLDRNELRMAATVYRAGDEGYWSTGVDGGKRQDGAGHLLQFEIMRDLRDRGFRWYDLGGVASTDESNGIFQFKRGFGGDFVSLGAEYGRRPPLVQLLLNLKRRVKF